MPLHLKKSLLSVFVFRPPLPPLPAAGNDNYSDEPEALYGGGARIVHGIIT